LVKNHLILLCLYQRLNYSSVAQLHNGLQVPLPAGLKASYRLHH